MFMHLAQILLFLVANGLVMLAIMTWFRDRQEMRDAASAYAIATITEQIMNGEYDSKPVANLNRDYDVLYYRYLANN